MTKVKIEFETIARLSKIKEIIGLKDSSRDYPLVKRVIEEVKNDNFFIFQGDERNLDKTVLEGSDGVVTGVGTLAPQIFVRLYESAARGDEEEAAKAQKEVLRLLEFCGDSWIAAIKYGMKLLGLADDYVCKPSCRVDEETKKKVESTLKELKVLK